MFSNLTRGSQLHILHKSATPYIEIGTVESTNSTPMMVYYPNMPQLPMELSVRVGEKITTYQQIPAGADSAEVTERTTGEQVIIACTKDAVNTELQAMKRESIDTINSVPYHQQRVKAIDTLIGQLNPEIVEKQQQAQEIIELKAQVTEMQALINELKGERASSPKRKEN